jgi:hypothetical protein
MGTDDQDQRGLIAQNVQLAIERLGPISDVDFGLNRESVQWVDGFIERQRARPDFDPDALGALPSVLGSFLGACVMEATGGEWVWMDEHGWGVRLPNGNAVFPFAKVEKQFQNGAEDSISSFYQIAVDLVATGKLRRR